MKIAIAASLQGAPEEHDTDTEDATRIANRASDILEQTLPDDFILDVFDRTDYPGTADQFSQLTRDVNTWGADLAVHVHQDAGGPGARGFTVLYYRAVSFAQLMLQGMDTVLSAYGVPSRGLSYRNDVTALTRANMPVVLVECGFYTSPADEAVGTEPYAQGIATGVMNYLREVLGIVIEEEKEESMKMYVQEVKNPDGSPVKDSNGWMMYNHPSVKKDWWLDISNEHGAPVKIRVWFNAQNKNVNTGGYAEDVVQPTTGTIPGMHRMMRDLAPAMNAEWSEMSIHAEKPLSIVVGN